MYNQDVIDIVWSLIQLLLHLMPVNNIMVFY